MTLSKPPETPNTLADSFISHEHHCTGYKPHECADEVTITLTGASACYFQRIFINQCVTELRYAIERDPDPHPDLYRNHDSPVIDELRKDGCVDKPAIAEGKRLIDDVIQKAQHAK